MASKNPRIDRDWREPIRKSEVATDFGITLARIQWDLFATPTFKGNVPRTNICYGMAFRWLQELAKVCGVPYKDSSINNIYNASVPRYFWMRGTSSGHTAEIATSLAASQ